MTDRKQQAIVVLTGAGISKESGLDTFRDSDGIWSKVSIEDVATPEAFVRNPTCVHEFYNARRASLKSSDITPNAAHTALARLEKEWPGDVLLVTQNIDDLHERGGVENLIHMHGELLKISCEFCGALMEWEDDLFTSTPCSNCSRKSGLRPHVVWFGEMPLSMDEIYEKLDRCSLFVSIGTSGNVYPAAGFVQHVRHRGQAYSVELNLEPSQGATLFSETIYGSATEIVPNFVDRLLEQGIPKVQ